MSTNELATYLFPVIEPTSHFPIVDLCTKWALLQKARQDRCIAAMMSGPTQIIRDWPVQRRIPSDGVPFDLFALSDNWCLKFLRFTKRQICEMAFLLAIPDHFPHRNFCPPTTALSLVCFQLAWPPHLKDCIHWFGRGRGWLSTIFNHTCVHISRQFSTMLRWNDDHLTPHRLSQYCAKTQERGEPSGLVWGFIDGTHKQTCRPRPESADQEIFYSGHKHMHSVQFLSVATPDGLISCLEGPYEGRKGDWGMWKDGLQELVLEKAWDDDGDRVYLFGDRAFYLEEGVIGAFQGRNGVALTEDESVFNAYMAKQRMAVEWGFGKVMQLFQFSNVKLMMKFGLSPIAPYYIVSVLLTNCHTCYFNSKTSMSFDCAPPDIRDYFGLTQDGKEELDLYLQLVLPDAPIENPVANEAAEE